MFLFSIKRVLALLVAAIMSIGVGSSSAKPITKNDDYKMTINIVSDVHVEGNNLTTYNNYGKILKSLKRSDAIANIFLGDNTMNGQDFESMLFYGALTRADLPGTIVACGNHDQGFEKSPGGYDEHYSRHENYNNYVLKSSVDGKHYCKVINGIYFIVMNPEGYAYYYNGERNQNINIISEEGYAFLDETLALAKENGAISFIVSHFPYNYTEDHGRQYRSIVSKYDNVFFLGGHTHIGPSAGFTFTRLNGMNHMNLPKCTEDYEINGKTSAGWGVRVEIYENKAVAHSYNFITGEVYSDIDYTYSLIK